MHPILSKLLENWRTVIIHPRLLKILENYREVVMPPRSVSEKELFFKLPRSNVKNFSSF